MSLPATRVIPLSRQHSYDPYVSCHYPLSGWNSYDPYVSCHYPLLVWFRYQGGILMTRMSHGTTRSSCDSAIRAAFLWPLCLMALPSCSCDSTIREAFLWPVCLMSLPATRVIRLLRRHSYDPYVSWHYTLLVWVRYQGGILMTHMSHVTTCYSCDYSIREAFLWPVCLMALPANLWFRYQDSILMARMSHVTTRYSCDSAIRAAILWLVCLMALPATRVIPLSRRHSYDPYVSWHYLLLVWFRYQGGILMTCMSHVTTCYLCDSAIKAAFLWPVCLMALPATRMIPLSRQHSYDSYVSWHYPLLVWFRYQGGILLTCMSHVSTCYLWDSAIRAAFLWPVCLMALPATRMIPLSRRHSYDSYISWHYQLLVWFLYQSGFLMTRMSHGSTHYLCDSAIKAAFLWPVCLMALPATCVILLWGQHSYDPYVSWHYPLLVCFLYQGGILMTRISHGTTRYSCVSSIRAAFLWPVFLTALPATRVIPLSGRHSYDPYVSWHYTLLVWFHYRGGILLTHMSHGTTRYSWDSAIRAAFFWPVCLLALPATRVIPLSGQHSYDPYVSWHYPLLVCFLYQGGILMTQMSHGTTCYSCDSAIRAAFLWLVFLMALPAIRVIPLSRRHSYDPYVSWHYLLLVWFRYQGGILMTCMSHVTTCYLCDSAIKAAFLWPVCLMALPATRMIPLSRQHSYDSYVSWHYPLLVWFRYQGGILLTCMSHVSTCYLWDSAIRAAFLWPVCLMALPATRMIPLSRRHSYDSYISWHYQLLVWFLYQSGFLMTRMSHGTTHYLCDSAIKAAFLWPVCLMALPATRVFPLSGRHSYDPYFSWHYPLLVCFLYQGGILMTRISHGTTRYSCDSAIRAAFLWPVCLMALHATRVIPLSGRHSSDPYVSCHYPLLVWFRYQGGILLTRMSLGTTRYSCDSAIRAAFFWPICLMALPATRVIPLSGRHSSDPYVSWHYPLLVWFRYQGSILMTRMSHGTTRYSCVSSIRAAFLWPRCLMALPATRVIPLSGRHSYDSYFSWHYPLLVWFRYQGGIFMTRMSHVTARYSCDSANKAEFLWLYATCHFPLLMM